MKIVVGLGNPGKEYEQTPHNAGFVAVEKLAEELSATWQKESSFKAYLAKAMVNGEKVILMKPLTFMNLSGEAVSAVANYFKVEPADVIVICDDVNLEPSRIRVRPSGSHGGHNGIRSIIDSLSSNKFIRVRIGVGRGVHPSENLVGHVLGKFSKEEADIMDKACVRASEASLSIINHGVEKTMNDFNAYIVADNSIEK